MKTIKFLWLLSAFFFISCESEIIESDLEESVITEEIVSEEDNVLIKFAKGLAWTIRENPSVREFIKEEASIQFDNDYDILYYFIKDKSVSGKQTFRDLLISNGLSDEDLDEIEEFYPLLTLYVPELPNFSAIDWDIHNQIPNVALSLRGSSEIDFYKADGSKFSMPIEDIPSFPVIGLKLNERLTVSNRNSEKSKNIDGRQLKYFSGDRYDFDFIDDAFNGLSEDYLKDKRDKKTERLADADVDPVSIAAFNSGVTWQRDYVYYGLTKTNTKGKFRDSYSEYITSINVSGDVMAVYKKISDQDGDSKFKSNILVSHKITPSQAAGWLEGNYEFRVTVKINGTNGTGPTLTKIFNVKGIDLFDLTYEQYGLGWRVKKVTSKSFSLGKRIPLVPWNLETYSSGWQFTISEFDISQEITKTKTNTSQNATNFGIEIGGGEKVKLGLEFGFSNTKTKTETYTVKSTLTSDELGETILSFKDKIVNSKWNWLDNAYNTHNIGTGQISMTVQPKNRYQ